MLSGTGALNFYDEGADAVRVRVPAKINLHLGVGDRRDDGYHHLTTVYQAISLYDEITIEANERAGIHVELAGEADHVIPVDDRNLAVAAVRLLAVHAGMKPHVSLRLRKRIPVAAGLAGGSADAAAALLAAARLWELPIERDELMNLAARLGSDVPFCLLGGTALGLGRGEQVRAVPSSGQYHWVVATSHGQLSTPAVYREVDRLREAGEGSYAADASSLLVAVRTGDARSLAGEVHNDMALAATTLRPEVLQVCEAGEADGALASLVSGSGPTVLFLARDQHHANALAGRLRMRRIAREVHIAHGPVQGAHLL